MRRVICITNNPIVRDSFAVALFVDGTADAVFAEARNLIHKGWRFLAHPLYGNFKPSRQPYRTLALECPRDGDNSVDLESFAMIEAAIGGMRGEPCPQITDEDVLGDFAVIDMELIKDTLYRYMKNDPNTGKEGAYEA